MLKTDLPATRSQRITTLDLLRGFFLFTIIIDHLQRFPDLFDLITGRGYLWVSAAEGFFFVSGMLLAMVRTRQADSEGMSSATKKILKRAVTLYVWSIALTLLFTYLAFYIGELHPGIKSGLIGRDSFGEILLDAVSLRYVYGWADFLPHYAIFMLGAPIAVWLMRRGRSDVVALASGAIWALTHSFTGRWQLVFYGGMLAGYHWHTVQAWIRERGGRWQRTATVGILGATATVMALSMLIVRFRSLFDGAAPTFAAQLSTYNDILEPWFDKTTLPWPRLVLFALWFTSLYIIFTRLQRPIRRLFGWFLLPLGRNSLFVYILHSIILFIVALAIPFSTPSILINLLISSSVLIIIWLLTQRHMIAKSYPGIIGYLTVSPVYDTMATSAILAYDALSRFVR